ncbi:MAG: hypothetical protein ABL971_01330 [Vicinamibacterales bacterium]
MRILFCALHFGAFRNYEPAIRTLAARGHQVHLTGDIPDVLGGQALVERLAVDCPSITWSMAPSLEGWPWQRLADRVRGGLETVRFADSAYDDQPKYRSRSLPRAPWIVAAITHSHAGRALAAPVLRAVERGIPPPRTLVTWMRGQAPDVVLLASVTNGGAPQMDHLKAALTLGLPVSLPVYSWDHLSGKAVLHVVPSQVLVWNETQQREAVTLHGLPAERVVVTGAYGYEQWLSRTPSRSRESFCAACGLDPARTVLVYVCSVLSRPAPPEAPFVLAWIRALRASADPVLREAGILVRPHPERLEEWDGVSFEGLGTVVLRGRNPIDPDAKDEYFDTLHYATAVVGVLTSAFIEAAVVGRPSLVIEAPEFREHQEGAPHYHYLRDPGNGLLLTAGDFEGHLKQLSRVVAGDQAVRVRTAAFVDRFVRPPAGHRSASETFAAAVETLVERQSASGASRPGQFGAGVPRLAAELLRGLDQIPVGRRLLRNERDRIVDARKVEVHHRREHRAADRDRRQAVEERERAAREQAKAERVREKQARIDARERDRAALKAQRERERAGKRAALEQRNRARAAENARSARRRRWRALLRRLRLGS